MLQQTRQIIAASLLITGLLLLMVNIYGVFQPLHPAGIQPENLRFGENDYSLNYAEALARLKRQANESETEFAARVTRVISQAIAHIHWEKYPPERFHQIVPIWENYFLYFMGKVSGIPEFERYHFADYHRSLERGIGVCGDAAMVLSQVLDEQGIRNKLITYPGHVLVSATIDGKPVSLDADFGVVLDYPPDTLAKRLNHARERYLAAGYTTNDATIMQIILQTPYQTWNGVSHMITKKYYFEKFAYAMKWPLPVILVIGGLWLIYRSRATRAT